MADLANAISKEIIKTIQLMRTNQINKRMEALKWDAINEDSNEDINF